MMTDPLVDQLRAADPAAGLDTDPHGARAQQVRDRACHAARALGRPARPRRQLGIAAAVGMLLLLSSAAAVASGIFQPDPEDVAGILAEAEEAGRHAVKTDGWRPTLRTEQVWCAYEDGTVGSTRSLDFALDEEMAEQDLVDACTGGPDEARHLGLDTGVAYTMCEGLARAEDLERLLANPDFAPRVIQGDITGDRPAFPVLLGWQADCGEVTLDTNAPAVELRALTSLAPVNRAREVEIGLTGAALQDCLTPAAAETMAHEAATELHGDWLIVDQAPEAGAELCRRVWVDARRGILAIGPPE